MEPQVEKKDKLSREIKGMLLGAAGLFLLIALASFNVEDLSFNSYSSETKVHNYGGFIGAQLADLLLQIFGLAGYLVPLALLYLSYRMLRFKEIRWKAHKFGAFLGLLVAVSALFAFNIEFTDLLGQRVPTGGAVGYKSVELLKSYLGVSGALLLLLPMLAASIMILSRFSFILYADWWINILGDKWMRYREKKALNRELLDKEPKPAGTAPVVIKPLPVTMPVPEKKKEKEKKRESEKSAPVQEAFEFIKADGSYRTPPLSLLDAPPNAERRVDKEALTMNARLLEKKLKDFGVDGAGSHHV